MTCPVDGTVLVMTARSNVEIDYCPSCRGVWLDRGELDKIIERTLAESAPVPAAAPPPPQPAPGYAAPPPQPYPPQHGGHYDPYRGSHGHDPYYGGHKPHKRRKSFLEELFD
jgi:hypothetical protein